MSSALTVDCPICARSVREANINKHIDSGCDISANLPSPSATPQNALLPRSSQVTAFFGTPAVKRSANLADLNSAPHSVSSTPKQPQNTATPLKRPLPAESPIDATNHADLPAPTPKRARTATNLDKAAPLPERMRPRTLDDVYGQDLVAPHGVLRSLIQSDRVPSMILWGGPGTGKTTIARLIANAAGNRFVEINSTSSGVAECKKLFTEAKNELSLTGRKTIIFCDEIHRFSKSQQDVFLAPVEAGTITLIGATTENPSFKIVNALMSRCRTFTLAKLSDETILAILKRAMSIESRDTAKAYPLLEFNDYELLQYLATFSDGDARTALNLLSLALDLSCRPDMTLDAIKSSLTQTLVYDRAGDQHYDTISAFHKSVRGSDPDATLYYLTRMLQSGEDPRYVARRMVVIASEDVGLADNSLLSLATATYQACETIGMPECRINLAHCAVALAMAPKSTRAYRAMNAAYAALNEPGLAGLPIPIHLRNAPTRLMKELGYGKEYKYNPHYVDGRVSQQYLPDKLQGRKFLDDMDLGTQVDPDLGGDVTLERAMPQCSNLNEQENNFSPEVSRTEEEMLLNPDGE